MSESPFPIDERCLKIIIWIYDFITGCSISDFKIKHILSSFIDQIICVSFPSREADAHTGR